MIFTPTSTSGAASGAGLWSLAWLSAFKIDTIAGYCGYRNSNIRSALFNFVNKNKAITLMGTEVVNIAMHFKALSSPNLMAFVLGGTLANVGWIFGIIPAFQATFGRKKVIG